MCVTRIVIKKRHSRAHYVQGRNYWNIGDKQHSVDGKLCQAAVQLTTWRRPPKAHGGQMIQSLLSKRVPHHTRRMKCKDWAMKQRKPDLGLCGAFRLAILDPLGLCLLLKETNGFRFSTPCFQFIRSLATLIIW